jgi:hypothetical protein
MAYMEVQARCYRILLSLDSQHMQQGSCIAIEGGRASPVREFEGRSYTWSRLVQRADSALL